MKPERPAQGADAPVCHCGFAKPVPGPHHLASCGMYEPGDRADMLRSAVPQGAADVANVYDIPRAEQDALLDEMLAECDAQGAAAEPTREEDDLTARLTRLVERREAANRERGADDGLVSVAGSDLRALLDRLAALRQFLASAEARERAIREAVVYECGCGVGDFPYSLLPCVACGKSVALPAIEAFRAALSPSPSEPAR